MQLKKPLNFLVYTNKAWIQCGLNLCLACVFTYRESANVKQQQQLRFFRKIKFVIVFAFFLIKPPFYEIFVSMNIDVEILV